MLVEILIYTVILLPLIYLFGREMFDGIFTQLLFTLIPAGYISIFFLDTKMGFFPHYPDSEGYRIAVEGNNIVFELKDVYIDFYYVNTLVRIMNGGVPLFIVLNSVMFTIGAALIWRAWSRSVEGRSSYSDVAFLLLLSLWPAAFLYIPALLREGQTIFFWGVCIYSFTILSRSPDWIGGWIFGLFGSVGLLYLRKEFLAAVLLFALIYTVVSSIRKTRYIFVLSAPTVFVVWFIFDAIGYSYLFNPTRLEKLRRVRTSPNKPAYMGSVNWETWLDVLFDSIFLAVFLFTSPLTTSPHPFKMLLASLDGLFVIFIILISIISLFIGEYRGGLGWILGTLIISAGFGIIEFHITGAVRHRMPLVLCLLPTAATTIAWVFEQQSRIPQVYFEH